MAQQMGIDSIGTFHKRYGDQVLINGSGTASAGWARVFGETHDQQWNSRVGGVNHELAPKFDGRIWGIQSGLNVAGWENSDGSLDRFGVFYTHADARGTVHGNTLALLGRRSGTHGLAGDSLGGYWTHIGSSGWYVDVVGMGTLLRSDASSDRRIGASLDGTQFAASIEAGYPVRLGPYWTIEPQGQLIWQRTSLGDTRDLFASINYKDLDGIVGRLGARVENDAQVNGIPLQTFVSVDLWRNLSGTDQVTFNHTTVATSLKGTSLELRGGVSMQISAKVSAYGAVNYTTNLGGEDLRSVGGNLGVRVRW